MGDRIQLQQVLLNLVINSIEAMTRVPEDRRQLVYRGTVACLGGQGAHLDHRNGLRNRPEGGGSAESFRSLLYNKSGRDGYGFGHQSFNRGSAWRTTMGHTECRSRGDLPAHVAGADLKGQAAESLVMLGPTS